MKEEYEVLGKTYKKENSVDWFWYKNIFYVCTFDLACYHQISHRHNIHASNSKGT